jgi:hypothetical protein
MSSWTKKKDSAFKRSKSTKKSKMERIVVSCFNKIKRNVMQEYDLKADDEVAMLL